MNNLWTPHEIEQLKKLYPTHSAKVIAQLLGRKKGSVYIKAFKLGLSKDPRVKTSITMEQKTWLRVHFPHMSNAICATYLNMSESSLHRIARRLKLRKTPQFIKECQRAAAHAAKASHIANGTYPPKGYYGPNLQKGETYKFKQHNKLEKLTTSPE
jgi:hypothetical protein